MFCYNCGQKINEDNNFCAYCGTNIRENNSEVKPGIYSVNERKNIDTSFQHNNKESSISTKSLLGCMLLITLIISFYVLSQVDFSELPNNLIFPTCERCDEIFFWPRYHGGYEYSTLCEDCAKEYWYPFPYQNYEK